MRNIKVKKENLLQVLKTNRKDHRDAFLQAQKAFRETVVKTLDEELAAARDGRPFVLQRITSLVQPSDHTDDYDRVIGMLEMDVIPEVELSEAEYKCYVDDDWGWMHQFANEVSTYNVSNSKLSRYTR